MNTLSTVSAQSSSQAGKDFRGFFGRKDRLWAGENEFVHRRWRETISSSEAENLTNLKSRLYEFVQLRVLSKGACHSLVEATSSAIRKRLPAVILRGISVSDFMEEIMSHLSESPAQLSPQTVVKPMRVSLAEDPRPMNTGSDLDSREVSLEAPAGTPAPLAETYEGIAQILFDASEMRRSPPRIREMFEKDARSLSSAWKASRERYTPVELLLQAEGEGGTCAHQDALNTICRINDACGHVMLGIVPFDEVTEHLRAVSVFDVAEQLKAMRRELSRAALRFRGHACDIHVSDAPSSETEIALPAKDTDTLEHTVAQGRPGARKTMKQPSKDAFTAYRAELATGKNQTELALILTNEWRRPVHQGTVSRWIDQVKSWLEAGNVLPDLSPPPNKKPTAIDPERIDLGERQDHRSERQRERRNSDAGD